MPSLLTHLTAERLGLLDASFLLAETRDTPMHVGGLQIYKLPPGAPPDFVKNVVERFRDEPELPRPWNLKLAPVLLSSVMPAVVEADDIDMMYHVRHSALPHPGGERELGELISHLHSQMLDRSRPLWTTHVIEGLEGDRFAIYGKAHHAITDGIRGIKLATRNLAREPDGAWAPPWRPRPKKKRSGPRSSARLPSLKDVRDALAGLMPPVFNREGGEPVRLPFEAPPSVLNCRVTAARRVATQQFPLKRLKVLARRAGGSVNDVFLALCGAALRRHLIALGALPQPPLIAAVPVSLRQEGDQSASNAVGFVWSSLATHLPDPRKRLEAIHASMQASKAHLATMSPEARSIFTMLAASPLILLRVGITLRRWPLMNTIVSNVPGPRGPLYLDGAEMEAYYPLSIPVQGMALNITCISYNGKLSVGFTGSRDGVPSLQRIAVYAGEALEELEEAV